MIYLSSSTTRSISLSALVVGRYLPISQRRRDAAAAAEAAAAAAHSACAAFAGPSPTPQHGAPLSRLASARVPTRSAPKCSGSCCATRSTVRRLRRPCCQRRTRLVSISWMSVAASTAVPTSLPHSKVPWSSLSAAVPRSWPSAGCFGGCRRCRRRRVPRRGRRAGERREHHAAGADTESAVRTIQAERQVAVASWMRGEGASAEGATPVRDHGLAFAAIRNLIIGNGCNGFLPDIGRGRLRSTVQHGQGRHRLDADAERFGDADAPGW